jgi:hypothetical protein
MSAGLTNGEVMQVVNRYIGVSGGYLGDFSYRTHAEFYPEYCELEIDPYEYEGTVYRDPFIEATHATSTDPGRSPRKVSCRTRPRSSYASSDEGES